MREHYANTPARRRWFDRMLWHMVQDVHTVKRALRAAGVRARVEPAIKPPPYHLGDVVLAGVRVTLLDD
jgi:hypothetical protein